MFSLFCLLNFRSGELGPIIKILNQ